MNLVDPDLLLSCCRLDLHPAVMADRQIQLGDLVVLGIIRIEIILPVKFAILVDTAVGSQTYGQGIFHHLLIENRQGAGHTGAHRAGMGVGRSSELGGASAEDLGSGSQLYMNLQTYDCFVLFAHLSHLRF